MIRPNIEPPGGAVRISIPASVANDLGAFQKSIALIARRLGCDECVSGWNCIFQSERNWVINEKLEIGAAASITDPIPMRTVTATMPLEVSRDLKKVHAAVARVADRIGCGACCSGFDILFRQELDFIVDANLNVNPIGPVR